MKRPGVIGLVLIVGVFSYFKFVHQAAPGTVEATSSVTKLADAASLTCPAKLGTTKRVGIQAGHWKITEVPDELSSISWDYGTSYSGVDEVDINLDVAQRTVALLTRQGIAADLLPATIPEDYCANAFVAIHADGNDDTTVYGYKVAPSFWDSDGKAQQLSDTLQRDYGDETGMYLSPAISDNMTQYYAFNYQRFTHTVDAKTPSALIELGFITNPTDRSMMVNQSDQMAQAIADGIVDYLKGDIAPTTSPTATP